MLKFSKIVLVLLFINSVRSRSLFSELPEIKNVTLERGRPLKLKSNFEKLQLCDLTGTIYSDSLSLLHNVTELRLCRNITTIEDNALCASKSIKILELDFYLNPKPPVLTKGTFGNCDNIEELLLKFNNQSDYRMDEDALENLSNLKKLHILGYDLRRLDKDFLKIPNSDITTLYLILDNIHKIDVNALINFPNLEILAIDHNELKTIPQGLFKNTPKLKVLMLSDNSIGNLTWEEFKGLGKLEELALDRNQITVWDVDKISKNLPGLRYISIALNPLTCQQKWDISNNLKSKFDSSLEVAIKFDPYSEDPCEK